MKLNLIQTDQLKQFDFKQTVIETRNFIFGVLNLCRVIRIAPFANRLAMSVPPHIQFLRCLTNYRALRFSPSISSLAEKLVYRMTEKSSRTDGKYIAVHLRFEEVLMLILSFSDLVVGVNMCFSMCQNSIIYWTESALSNPDLFFSTCRT